MRLGDGALYYRASLAAISLRQPPSYGSVPVAAVNTSTVSRSVARSTMIEIARPRRNDQCRRRVLPTLIRVITTAPDWRSIMRSLFLGDGHNGNVTLYTGWSYVTESMVTIRSPFRGYSSAYCVELKGEGLRSYSRKTESASLRKCPYDY